MSGIPNENDLNTSIRESIRKHVNFQAMYESVSAHTQQLIDTLLTCNVTPSLIRSARQAPPQEFRRYSFLRALHGGNPSPLVAPQLTEAVLGFLVMGLDQFVESKDDE